MKIALIHGKALHPNLSGASKAMVNLAKALSYLGNEVTIISADKKLDIPNVNHLQSLPISYLGYSYTYSSSPIKIFESIKKVLNLIVYYFYTTYLIKKYKFDIVDNQGFWTDNYNVLTIRFLMKGYSNAMKRNLNIIQKITNLKFYFLSLIELYYFKIKRPRLVITNCNKTKRNIVNLYKFDEKKIKVIPNGLDPASFFSKNYNKEKLIKKYKFSKNFRFIFVGQNSKRKNLSLFLEVTKRYPHCDFLIVGIPLHEVLKEEKIEKNVAIIEYNDKIWEMFACSDIFFFPTFYEGGAKVIQEAMISGNCVITTKESGGEDWITNGKNGFIVNIHNKKKLYNLIDSLLNNPKKLSKIRKEARSLKWDSWEKVAKKRIKYYKKILN